MEFNKWFAPDSMMRQVGQEALGLLGGGRAVLLQLAHPLVAAGVAEHSDFQTDPLTRLLRTLQLMHAIVYGSHHEATQALERFHSVHARIHGNLPHAAGRYPVGTSYSANDPELKLWVFATLIDTSLITYQAFVAPLASDEQRQFYADAGRLGQLLGIPAVDIPPTLDGFQCYVTDMLTDDALTVTDTARRLAHDVLHPDVGIISAASALLLRFVTAGMLPRRLRDAYGLEWNTQRQRLLDRLSQTTRLLRPIVPVWVWQSPQLGGSLPRWLLWRAIETER